MTHKVKIGDRVTLPKIWRPGWYITIDAMDGRRLIYGTDENGRKEVYPAGLAWEIYDEAKHGKKTA